MSDGYFSWVTICCLLLFITESRKNPRKKKFNRNSVKNCYWSSTYRNRSQMMSILYILDILLTFEIEPIMVPNGTGGHLRILRCLAFPFFSSTIPSTYNQLFKSLLLILFPS